ncbi:MAG: hypothetical protein KBB37_10585 [Bacteroidia bacterium]|nr:hypothetical protein [Bacteroidia bacterium]MBP7261723.1 hypothetical protein [Bacteroidia bacterium]MBP9180890.1 hypothetical protein [Bacteroidia bacterium]MBP9725406.1 hypothetical protein [Bacteroidia bacterium]
MKTLFINIVIASTFLFVQCQKDDEHDYPDLSYVGNLGGILQKSKGYWVFVYQYIDSISKDSVVYLDKDWPKIGSSSKGFWLVRLDNSNRKYLHVTEFRYNNTDYKHIDTIYISKGDNLIKLNTYQGSSFTTMPIKEGTFIGRYNQNYKRIEGFYRYPVFYHVGASEVRRAIANVNAYCE